MQHGPRSPNQVAPRTLSTKTQTGYGEAQLPLTHKMGRELSCEKGVSSCLAVYPTDKFPAGLGAQDFRDQLRRLLASEPVETIHVQDEVARVCLIRPMIIQ